MFAAGLLYLNSVAPGRFVVGLAVAVVVCRLMHAAGMFFTPSVNERHPLRFIGALGTYFCLFALGGALAVYWFQAGA